MQTQVQELKAKGWIVMEINGELRAHNPDFYAHVYLSLNDALAAQQYYENHG